jgi:hypothetical protein
VAFVTLAQAKTHLLIDTPADDPGDPAIQDLIDRATAIILDYLKNPAPAEPDLVISQAILLELAELDRFRGDDSDTDRQSLTDGDLSPVITNLLRRKRIPAMA